MIHTHNDNSVNFLSPESGGRGGGEDFGDHLVVRGTVGGDQWSPTEYKGGSI